MSKKSNSSNFVLVDVTAIFYRAVFALQKNEKEDFLYENYNDENGLIKNRMKQEVFDNEFKSYFWHILMGVVDKFKGSTQCVLCHDGGSWRHEIFPHYKKVRKTKASADLFDWKDFFSMVGGFCDELNEEAPFISMRLKNCEGDDIIGTMAVGLAQEYPDSTITIYSADKDFIQLLKYPNIKLYSIMKRKFVKCSNPKNELLTHILLGDAVDGIPHVWNTGDHYVKLQQLRESGIKSKRPVGRSLGEKRVRRAISENKVFESIVNTPDIQRRFDENQLLIDLEKIPIDIKKRIFKEYHEKLEEHKTKSPADLQRYFVKRGFQSLSQNLYKFMHLF